VSTAPGQRYWATPQAGIWARTHGHQEFLDFLWPLTCPQDAETRHHLGLNHGRMGDLEDSRL
jgi:hypothetical protein